MHSFFISRSQENMTNVYKSCFPTMVLPTQGEMDDRGENSLRIPKA
jgi:hypothetical protein